MPCPKTQHQKNAVQAFPQDIFWRILHQAGIKLARQAADIAKRYALTIVPRPSLNCIIKSAVVYTMYYI